MMSGGQLSSWFSFSKSKASPQMCIQAWRNNLWKTDFSWALVSSEWWLTGEPKGCLCFVLFCPLTVISRSDLSGWRCWSTLLVSLLASARGKQALSVSSQGLGTLSSAPGRGVGTAELSWGAFVPQSRDADEMLISSQVCHVDSSLELPEEEHGQRQWSWEGIQQGWIALKKAPRKWGVPWTQGRILEFLKSVSRRWGKWREILEFLGFSLTRLFGGEDTAIENKESLWAWLWSGWQLEEGAGWDVVGSGAQPPLEKVTL